MLPDDLAHLIEYDADSLRVTSRESKTREFKERMSADELSEYGRTLAAFANADGGVIVFGVADRPKLIVGLDPATIIDEARWADRLREDFQPELPITTRSYMVGDKALFAVAVARCPHRPVICRKVRTRRIVDRKGVSRDVEILRSGHIYYRHSGQTRLIEHDELVAILDDREQSRMKAILDTLKAVERVGYDRVGIIDVSTIGAAGTATNLYVSRETAKTLNFIDRGRFVEAGEDGAPAYMVAGTVTLNQVVATPLDAADKNFPGEVADKLKVTIRSIFGNNATISASQVTKLLRHYRLDELPYSQYDAKVKRRYITREGIRAVKARLEANPLDAIRSFGSKVSIATYEARHVRPSA